MNMITGHMRGTLVALALVLPALSSVAQTPMSAEEFEAYVTGRTLTFGSGGAPYGIEEFRPGRRTIWAFTGDQCREGHWFPRDEQICFVYDDTPQTEHCWIFWRSDRGLNASFMDDSSDTELYEVENSPRPLICPGPQVGV